MKFDAAVRLAGQWERDGLVPLSDPVLVREVIITFRRYVHDLVSSLAAEQNKIELLRRQREEAERQAHEARQHAERADQLVRHVFGMNWACTECKTALTMEDLGA